MLRKLIPGVTAIIFLGSCTALKPISNTSNKSSASAPVESNEIKFIDNIENTNSSVQVAQKQTSQAIKKDDQINDQSFSSQPVKNESIQTGNYLSTSVASFKDIEKANSLQFKYASLLNTNVEEIQNLPLYQKIDEWYGTKFRYGGTSKKGIDCSAFVQTVFISVYGLSLPRNARDQYKVVSRISTTELKEGDLLFFNTTGGVSHVGIYLQNNKFVHATVSKGIMISDMFEPYYVRRFIGAGRIAQSTSALSH